MAKGQDQPLRPSPDGKGFVSKLLKRRADAHPEKPCECTDCLSLDGLTPPARFGNQFHPYIREKKSKEDQVKQVLPEKESKFADRTV